VDRSRLGLVEKGKTERGTSWETQKRRGEASQQGGQSRHIQKKRADNRGERALNGGGEKELRT